MLEMAAFLAAGPARSWLRGFGLKNAAAGYAKTQASAMGLTEGSWRYAARTSALQSKFGAMMEQKTWGAFLGTPGGITRRWAAAKTAAGWSILHDAKGGIKLLGGGRVTTKAMASRAAATGLASGALSVGMGYLMWGTIPPMMFDMAVGGFQTLSDIGRELRQRGPSTATRFFDTRQAATMRQAGLQAMHEAGMGGYRNAIGTEAQFFHR